MWRFARSDLHYFTGMDRLFRAFYQAVLGGGEAPVPEREVRRVTTVMDQVFAACHEVDKPARPATRDRADADRRTTAGVVA